MPTFVLCIKAELENIAKLDIEPGARFCIDVKESAGSETRERVYVTAAEEHELSGSKGSANFIMKFAKDARHECSINVMQLKGVTRPLTDEDDGKFAPLMAFECRGIEPTAFHPEDGWVVTTKGNKKFEDVDLTEREWVEFDDKINDSVGIYNFEAKFELHKGK